MRKRSSSPCGAEPRARRPTTRSSSPLDAQASLKSGIWDLCSYASVKAFANKASANLDRLDVVVNNAGILTYDFELAEDNESTVTVNVVSAMMLSILLLPKLRETSVRLRKEAVLTFTGSFVHFMTDFPERKAENILKDLAIEKKADIKNRSVSVQTAHERRRC